MMYSHTLHVELKCTVLEFDSKIIVIYVTHTSVEFLHAKCVSCCIEYTWYNMMREDFSDWLPRGVILIFVHSAQHL